jgi:hypothetical protein
VPTMATGAICLKDEVLGLFTETGFPGRNSLIDCKSEVKGGGIRYCKSVTYSSFAGRYGSRWLTLLVLVVEVKLLFFC